MPSMSRVTGSSGAGTSSRPAAVCTHIPPPERGAGRMASGPGLTVGPSRGSTGPADATGGINRPNRAEWRLGITTARTSTRSTSLAVVLLLLVAPWTADVGAHRRPVLLCVAHHGSSGRGQAAVRTSVPL